MIKISKKAVIIFKVILTVALIAFLLKRVDMGEVLSLIKQVKVEYLFLSGILYIFFMLVAAYRWQCLLNIQKIKIGLGKVIRLTFMGYFFNNFLPTTVGGDVVKGYLVSRDTKKVAESYVSILMDRVTGLGGLVLLAVLVILFIPTVSINRNIIYLVWGCFVCFVVLLIISTVGGKFFGKKLGWLKRLARKLKIEDKITKVYNIFYTHKEYKGVLVKTIFLSLIIQVTFIFINYLLVRGLPLNRDIPIGYFFIYTPTIALISSLPVTINGIGVRENLYVEFFGGILGKDAAGSLSILLLLFLWAAGLIGGVYYLFSNFRSTPIKTLVEKEELNL